MYENHLNSHIKGRKKLKEVRKKYKDQLVRRIHKAQKPNIFKCTTSILKRIKLHPFRSEFKYKKETLKSSKMPVRKLIFSSLCCKKIKVLEQKVTVSQNVIPQARVSSTSFTESDVSTPCNQNYIPLDCCDNNSAHFHDSPETDQIRDDEDSEMERIKQFAEQNPKLLLDLMHAISIEKSQCDTKKFGSIFSHLSQSLVTGALKADQLCYKIAVSIATLKNSQSKKMVYTPAEYEFWEYINYLHCESTLRNLTGKKGYG